MGASQSSDTSPDDLNIFLSKDTEKVYQKALQELQLSSQQPDFTKVVIFSEHFQQKFKYQEMLESKEKVIYCSKFTIGDLMSDNPYLFVRLLQNLEIQILLLKKFTTDNGMIKLAKKEHNFQIFNRDCSLVFDRPLCTDKFKLTGKFLLNFEGSEYYEAELHQNHINLKLKNSQKWKNVKKFLLNDHLALALSFLEEKEVNIQNITIYEKCIYLNVTFIDQKIHHFGQDFEIISLDVFEEKKIRIKGKDSCKNEWKLIITPENQNKNLFYLNYFGNVQILAKILPGEKELRNWNFLGNIEAKLKVKFESLSQCETQLLGFDATINKFIDLKLQNHQVTLIFNGNQVFEFFDRKLVKHNNQDVFKIPSSTFSIFSITKEHDKLGFLDCKQIILSNIPELLFQGTYQVENGSKNVDFFLRYSFLFNDFEYQENGKLLHGNQIIFSIQPVNFIDVTFYFP